MATHARTTALTLYRSGTLTLSQAAARAGLTTADFERVCRRHGIAVRETGQTDDGVQSATPTSAD